MLTMTTAGHNRRVFRVELFESENIFFKRSGEGARRLQARSAWKKKDRLTDLRLWLKASRSCKATRRNPEAQQVFWHLESVCVEMHFSATPHMRFTAAQQFNGHRVWCLTFHPVNHLTRAPLAHGLHNQCHGRSLSSRLTKEKKNPTHTHSPQTKLPTQNVKKTKKNK